jgi:DNA-binding CsgD family transcriptional regulator
MLAGEDDGVRPPDAQLMFLWPSESCGADSSVFSEKQWQAVARRLHLSPRELEIVRGIFDNSKENRIAEQMNVSPYTVHEYLKRLYRKLDVSGRVQLVLVLVKNHLSLTTSPEDDGVYQLEEAG